MANKTHFSPASKKGHFDGLVDEGEYLRQSSLYKQILPRPVRRSFSEGGTQSWPKILYPLWLYSLCSSCLRGEKICEISVNPRLINDLRLRKITYEKIKLFLQNEPKFRKVKLNVNKVLTKDYDKMDTWSIGKNEPKRTQNEPKRSQNKPNSNPIQSQYKPNTKPIQSQTNPILARHQCGGTEAKKC